MDKGLDIEAAFHVAVVHVALNGRPNRLLDCLARLRTEIEAAAPPSALTRIVRQSLSALALAPDWKAGERLTAWLSPPCRRQLVLGDPDYPPLLAAIPGPPPVLLVDGMQGVLDRPQVAIVGSRRATPAAREFAHDLAADLVGVGLTVTSGLAAGVDGAAHTGALRAGGSTIAVFGCGLDHIYPRRHRVLAGHVREAGAMVSEFPLGTRPLPAHFPRRNRIISGLALGTIVVEAALTSGSLVTARHALDQGREVFAVPGAVRNPLSRGCHALIRDGAVLTECATDVIDSLPAFVALTTPSTCLRDLNSAGIAMGSLPSERRRVFEACDFVPRGIDLIVEECGLTTPEVSSILTEFEMQGVVCAVDGGAYVRTGKIPA